MTRMPQRQPRGRVGRAAVWRLTCVLVNKRAHSVQCTNAAYEIEIIKILYKCIVNFKYSFDLINVVESNLSKRNRGRGLRTN